jgi:sulfur-carrier protein adenylyltransferase/sulfurtransferase
LSDYELIAKMKTLPALTREEITRYSRHILLPEIGMKGQQKLKAASVLIVGVGGLGSPIGLYLAAAGIGRIGLVDPDVVDRTNLQRQIIHSTVTEGELKVESARQRMLELNPDIHIKTFATAINSTNALEITEDYDILIDGSDNIPTRYLLSDLAVLTHKPYVYGSIFRFEGQVSVFGLSEQPCYRCLFPEPPPPDMIPSCSTAGVMGILPGTIGTIQATEVIKLLTGIGKPLAGKLLLYDALDMSFDIVNLRRNVNCPACGDHPTVTDLIDYNLWCGLGSEPDPGSAGQDLDIEPTQLAEIIASKAEVNLVDVRESFESNLAMIQNSVTIPVDELSQRMKEIGDKNLTVLYCRNGIRSAKAVISLSSGGYCNVRNLHGGINAWIDQVDPSQTKY